MVATVRRPTAADVAAAAGVSRATVSFVLNATPGQTISPAVSQRVHDAATRLGYRPHAHARALVSGSSRIILVPLPRWPVEYALRQILDEATVALDEAGYALVTAPASHSGRTRPLWESLQPDVVLPIEPLPQRETAAITDLGIRVVDVEASQSEFVGSVDAQVTHLLDRGHHILAYASTTVVGMEAMNEARLTRARALCAEAGVSLIDAPISDSDAGRVVSDWRAAGVTAVLAFNDDTAATVLGVGLRHGVSVPSELAVIGHDDSPIARLLVPSLTSVRFDITGLGRHFAELALATASGNPPPPDGPPPIHARVIRRETT